MVSDKTFYKWIHVAWFMFEMLTPSEQQDVLEEMKRFDEVLEELGDIFNDCDQEV